MFPEICSNLLNAAACVWVMENGRSLLLYDRNSCNCFIIGERGLFLEKYSYIMNQKTKGQICRNIWLSAKSVLFLVCMSELAV